MAKATQPMEPSARASSDQTSTTSRSGSSLPPTSFGTETALRPASAILVRAMGSNDPPAGAAAPIASSSAKRAEACWEGDMAGFLHVEEGALRVWPLVPHCTGPRDVVHEGPAAAVDGRRTEPA